MNDTNETKAIAKLVIKLFVVGIMIVLMDNYIPKRDYHTIDRMILVALMVIGIFLSFLNGKINQIAYFLLVYILYPFLFSFMLFQTWHFFIIMSATLTIMNIEQIIGFLKLVKNKRE
ncbi:MULTISPECIES: hypothetical protein [unclassified Moraxella]|uniref:hypothetical protein n=1 Tax=unclassified Moraxella TaxID=2685852 RepID=UPI002B40E72C|nr:MULTISPECIES: hypothetical protein [unclassified Moraxella]